MKAIIFILVSLFLGKGCSQEAKADLENTIIEYSANSRGFYQKIVIKNQTISISKDRNGKGNGETSKISDKDWKELIGYFQKVDKENLPNLKDPTQKRFYDGAAIANLKVIYKDNEFMTTDFDHGFPPAEIEQLVNKIVSLGIQE